MEFLIRLIAKISIVGSDSGHSFAVPARLQYGNQEVFMKNLVFLRTVAALTLITVVLERLAEIAPAAVA